MFLYSTASNMATASWLTIHEDSDFSLSNIPFGVATLKADLNNNSNGTPFCATAVGDHVINLGILQDAGAFDSIADLLPDTFQQETLNHFLEQSPTVWPLVRQRLISLLGVQDGDDWLRNNDALKKSCIYDRSQIQMHLPLKINEYTDFYSSREHATNVGVRFPIFLC